MLKGERIAESINWKVAKVFNFGISVVVVRCNKVNNNRKEYKFLEATEMSR